jgi:hypothetical protein
LGSTLALVTLKCFFQCRVWFSKLHQIFLGIKLLLTTSKLSFFFPFFFLLSNN